MMLQINMYQMEKRSEINMQQMEKRLEDKMKEGFDQILKRLPAAWTVWLQAKVHHKADALSDGLRISLSIYAFKSRGC